MTYFSIDIETTGPCPSTNHMLSVGCFALDDELNDLTGFQANICQHYEHAKDPYNSKRGNNPETMKWWLTQPPEAWQAAVENAKTPQVAMRDFAAWIESFPKPRIAVAYPAGFDFSFVYTYFEEYLGHCPFGFQCIDIKTLAWTRLGGTYRSISKKKMPKVWFAGLPPHTHVALDDAREQAYLFRNIMRHT